MKRAFTYVKNSAAMSELAVNLSSICTNSATIFQLICSASLLARIPKKLISRDNYLTRRALGAKARVTFSLGQNRRQTRRLQPFEFAAGVYIVTKAKHFSDCSRAASDLHDARSANNRFGLLLSVGKGLLLLGSFFLPVKDKPYPPGWAVE